MTYKLSLAMFPEDWTEEQESGLKLSVRYLAVGIVEKGKLTGIVCDYQGGGSYADEYMFQGKREDDFGEDTTAEDMSDMIEKKYPGLLKQAYALMDGYTQQDKENPGRLLATPKMIREYHKKYDYPEVMAIGKKFKLPQIGNTYFSGR